MSRRRLWLLIIITTACDPGALWLLKGLYEVDIILTREFNP